MQGLVLTHSLGGYSPSWKGRCAGEESKAADVGRENVGRREKKLVPPL